MKIPDRQRLLIILAGSVLALLVADRVVFTPLARAWSDRSREITQLKTRVAEGNALLKREQVVRSTWAQRRANTLPDNPTAAQEQVRNALLTWGQESGASLDAISPQWKSDSDNYKTLVYRIDASGSLWYLSRFLYDVEKGPLALKIESLDLTSSDNTGQVLKLGLQISGLALTPNRK